MKNSLMNRRELARGAAAGGAGLLFGVGAFAETAAKAGGSFINVREFGAVGDGVADDTAVLQRALEAAAGGSGTVFFPPGLYLTRELHVRAGTALVGIPAWNYSGVGGSALRLADGPSSCLLNLTDARGATIDGLALDGRFLGTGVHGIATDRSKWGEHEDGFRIERCQVVNFTGDGAHLACAWCFSVRHCEFAYNHGDGLSRGVGRFSAGQLVLRQQARGVCGAAGECFGDVYGQPH